MPFEPLQQQEARPAQTTFQPLAPSYNYVAPDDDGEETIMFQGNDKPVKAPAGTGLAFSQIENDDAFDPPPTTVGEETTATFEKQAAYLALVANAYGIIPDDGIADFVADRSRALSYAQKNQPEYMERFNAKLDNAKGFWESAGVFMSGDGIRAMGRTAITGSANSALPLITTAIGAKTGAIVGGLAGSAVPVAGTGAGAIVGGVTGGAAGAFAGGAMIEIGATIDQLMQQSGVDVTDATQVMKALQNETLMNDIKIKAEKKGITTASVDALFQVVGGRFLKSFAAASAGKKVGAAAADVGVQSLGEFTGEAAGQQVAFGKIDYKDAAMEAVSSIAQSAGQTAIGATMQKGKATQAQAEQSKPVEAAPISAPQAAQAEAKISNELIAYHQTNSDFNTFDFDKSADGTIWFSTDPQSFSDETSAAQAAAGANRVVTASLNLKKVAGWDEIDSKMIDQLVADGYDGAVLDGDVQVFNPDAIKVLSNVAKKDFKAYDASAAQSPMQQDEAAAVIIDNEITDGAFDPKVAAQNIIDSPQVSDEAKANVRALGQKFTIEQLQKAVSAKANEAIAPIVAQEAKAKSQKLEAIQAETDDISINILREISAIQDQKADIDPETQQMLEQTAEVLKAKRATPKPVSLSAFVKSLGGVQEYSGELQNIGISKKNGIRNEKGMLLDDAGEAAWKEGYFAERPTVEEFIYALGEDFNGRTVLNGNDWVNQENLNQMEAVLDQLDRGLSEKGVTYSREALQKLRTRVRENIKLDKAAAAQARVAEMDSLRLSAAKNKVESNPTKVFADKLKTFVQGMRKGGVVQKQETKAVQESLISMIEESGLDAADRAKFVRTVKNTQTIEQLDAKLPEIVESVDALLEAATRRDVLSKIEKVAKTAGKSQMIAADMAKRIQEMVSSIDLKGRKVETTNKLEATLEYFRKNPDDRAPAYVIKELSRLSKKQVADISTAELQSFLGELQNIETQGRTKQKLKEAAVARKQERRLAELAASVKPISSTPLLGRSIGERFSLMDEVKNKFITASNKARSVNLALNPMDVFFDMMDNNADYKGSAHTIFKKTVDASFGRYLNLKESVTRDVKNLADKLNLDDGNFERIGVYAAAKQEGGMKKLAATGVTQEQVEAITLNDNEMQFYNLMREKLDAMYPAINKVMIDVYNKNVDQVGDYFPFMTDFDAMKDLPIEEMVGGSAPSLTVKKKNVEKGFTKSRTGGAQTIKLDAMRVFMQHVDNAAYLVEMSRDVKELGELAKTAKFGESAGDMAQEFVVDWIDLLARKGNAPNRLARVDALRKNVGAAVLAYKLSSVLIQPTALLDGAALIGGDYVARGAKEVATSTEWRSFLKQNMPEIRERVGDDPSYIEMGGKTIIGKTQEAGFWALKNVDLLCASSVAAGAYIRSVEQRGGTVDLNAPDAQALEDAQLYLRRTQSSGFAKDSPMVISSGKLTDNASLDKLIFQFQSFMLNRWSVIKHDMVKVGIGRGKTQQAMNAAIFLTLAGAAEIGVRRLSKEMIAALVGGDDLDPWEETIGEEAVKTAFGTMPIVSNLVGSMEYGSNPVPAVSLINDIFKKLQYANQSKTMDKKMKHYVSAGIIATGTAFGIAGTLQAEQLTRKIMTDDKKKTKSGF